MTRIDGVTVHLPTEDALMARIALMNQAYYYERKGQDRPAERYREVARRIGDAHGDALAGDDTQTGERR